MRIRAKKNMCAKRTYWFVRVQRYTTKLYNLDVIISLFLRNWIKTLRSKNSTEGSITEFAIVKKDQLGLYSVVKFVDDDFTLDVRADKENETVWLTQSEMALLFDVDVGRISRHISNIFKEGELPRKSNLRKTQFTGIDKPNGLYSLDVIISVGNRVRSKRGILFRKWANKILKDYLIQGYAVNQRRLDNLGKVIDIQNRMPFYLIKINPQYQGIIVTFFEKRN